MPTATLAAARDGNIDSAVSLARQAVAEHPRNPAPAFLLCCLLLQRQDPEANSLLAALEAFRSYAPGWEQLGDALLARHPAAGRVALQRAAEAYAAAEAMAPHAETAYRLGMVLRRLGQLHPARAALERATSRNPGLAHAWYSLGLLQQDLHDGPAAIEAFRSALHARPDFHEAAFNLGVACQECGNLEAAMDAYGCAWRLRPDSFGRIAQALASHATGRLWLNPSALLHDLSARI